MRFSVAAALLSAGVALAQTNHAVQVGGSGALTYTPNQLTGVQNGDTITFTFVEKNHTVTQSTFPAPCSNITDATTGAVTGVDSGFQFVDPNATQFPSWTITVNNASTPLWFYCRQAKHCQAGMVFAVNPTEAKTFAMYASNAAASTAVNGSPSTSNTTSTSSSASAGASGAAAASGASAATSAASGATTPSPSATGTTNTNGASGLRYSAGATLLSLAGLSLGLLL